MPGKKWTHAEVSNLVKWYGVEGHSREAISKTLNRTISAVDNKIERLHLIRHPQALVKQPYLKNSDVLLRFLGMSQDELMRFFGIVEYKQIHVLG